MQSVLKPLILNSLIAWSCLGMSSVVLAEHHGPHQHHHAHGAQKSQPDPSAKHADHAQHDHDAHAHHHGPHLITDPANADWNDAFNRGDSQALSALYAEDATLSPGNGQVLRGRTAIANLFQSFFDMGLTNHRIEPIESYFNFEQLVQLAVWRADLPQADGVVELHGVLMLVLVEDEDSGAWSIASHIWNMASE